LSWIFKGEYRAARQQGGSLATLTWTLPAGGQSVVLFSAVNAAATAAASNRKGSGESNAASAFSVEKRRPIRADDDSTQHTHFYFPLIEIAIHLLYLTNSFHPI
jgi:hypothetical protein